MRSGDRVVASWLHPAEAITPHFVDSIHAVERTSERLAGSLPVPAGANIVNARNAQVRLFLDHTDAEWLWIVDSDMAFPADTLERLCTAAHDTDRPIVGGLCFSLLTHPTGIEYPAPTLYRLSDTPGVMLRLWDWPEGLVEVDATGAACILIHRLVLERMRATHDEPWPWFCELAMDGRPVSEDVVFCLRARQLDVPIHVDTRVLVDHMKLLPVNAGMYAGFRHGPAFDMVTGDRLQVPA